ncbi:lipopolysaccharide heptosyltransferase II [Hydrogenophaga sp. A37]|uniref:lipopolysaccharide heptosyltransferase II n=1 Tax=Hydrogenophaga sp. A37 TaxID=1945864 RepID=UPI000984349A|nr:lipopolysaccharide heptosyltransferase II [Hydrogenophaga sp. A37]OOG80904.1 lipopolysaccharide heptosyltransferase II [Hydrogenophaga sp. A37]
MNPASVASSAWAAARHILAIRLDHLGDVLMTTPALAAVKRQHPDVRLSLLTSPSGAEAAQHVPEIDRCLVHAAAWMKHDPGHEPVKATRALVQQLTDEHFDAAIIFTTCTQSALPAALLCHLAGIPLRLAHCRENPYALLTDWVPDHEVCSRGMRHEVRRQLDLVRSVGFHPTDDRLRMRFAASDTTRMREVFAAAGGDPDQPYLVVHPGATAASRRYPAERFGRAADALAEATGCQIVFTGSHDERPLVDKAAASMRHHTPITLAGQLSLGQLAALVASAQALVCNNTGPAHMAAALGTPVVVLYALTNPQHTPWRTPSRVLSHDVPCRHCLKSVCPQGHHACLLGIEPDEVVRAVLDLLGTPVAVPLVSAMSHAPRAGALSRVSP